MNQTGEPCNIRFDDTVNGIFAQKESESIHRLIDMFYPVTPSPLVVVENDRKDERSRDVVLSRS